MAEYGGLGLIIVDYLQLMRADARIENRVQQVGEMSRGLKILARELSVPVIALVAALARRRVADRQAPDALRPARVRPDRAGRRPRDVHLPRRVLLPREHRGARDEAEIIIAKHRNGGLGDVPLTFQNEYPRFLGLQRAA